MARSQASLLWEHLWPWLPGYLDAVTDLGAPALAGWARLTRCVIDAEFRAARTGKFLRDRAAEVMRL